MNHLLSRRKLCQLAVSLPISAPLAGIAFAESHSDFSYIRVNNDAALPFLSKGDFALVDSEVTIFTGDGLYIYPDWGNPVIYEVRLNSENTMEFYYPGKQKILWKINSNNPDARFAGRVTGRVTAEFIATDATTILQVPELPGEPLINQRFPGA